MSKPPPIPPEQRTFVDDNAAGRLNSARPDRRDLQSREPSTVRGDIDHQGRSGDPKRIVAPQRTVQDH